MLLISCIVLSLRVWTQLHHRLGRFQEEALQNPQPASRRPWRLLWLSRFTFIAVLLQILALLSLLLAATPGRIPLALALLLQPLEIVIKAVAIWAVVALLQLMLRLLLRQWRSNPDVPWEQ